MALFKNNEKTLKNNIFCFQGELLALNQLFKEISSVLSISIRLFSWLPPSYTQVSSAFNILKSIEDILHILLNDKFKVLAQE